MYSNVTYMLLLNCALKLVEEIISSATKCLSFNIELQHIRMSSIKFKSSTTSLKTLTVNVQYSIDQLKTKTNLQYI